MALVVVETVTVSELTSGAIVKTATPDELVSAEVPCTVTVSFGNTEPPIAPLKAVTVMVSVDP